MTEKLRRDQLPTEVRDEVWQVFEKAQKVIPIELVYDPTRADGEYKYANAHFGFGFYQGKVKFQIRYYNPNIKEVTLYHEILHVTFFIEGYPSYRSYSDSESNDGLIGDISSVIQHFKIFPMLKDMGFDIVGLTFEQWNTSYSGHRKEMLGLMDAPIEYINAYEGILTLLGLNQGLKTSDIEEILNPVGDKGIEMGAKVYKKYHSNKIMSKTRMFQAHIDVYNTFYPFFYFNQVTIAKLDFHKGKIREYMPSNGKLYSEEPITW